MIKAVNENRLLKKVVNFFKNPAAILIEIAQNAQRAGAKKLEITFKDGILTARDNGHGAGDIMPILTLADSDWDAVVERDHDPAGWGLFGLMAASLTLTVQSRFGSLTFDCHNFLNDEAYRENIERMLDKDNVCDGFSIAAVLKESSAKNIMNAYEHNLGYFPLDIIVNGAKVARETAAKDCKQYPLKTVYEGNAVFIDPHKADRLSSFPDSVNDLIGAYAGLSVIWYGIRIGKGGSCITLDVTTGSPVTPKLPDRDSLVVDDKLHKFYEFVRKTTVEYCIGEINGRKLKDADPGLRSLLYVMSQIGNGDELNRLSRYFVHRENKYNDSDHGGYNFTVVRPDDKLVNESVTVHVDFGDGKGPVEASEDELHLESGIISGINIPKKYPAWLKIEEKGYPIYVSAENTLRGCFNWYKSSVKCEGKEIIILALVRGYDDGDVFYSANPRDFHAISGSVFKRDIHSEDMDSDTWDTQEERFNTDIDKDISSITGTYSLLDILSGLARALDIDYSGVTVGYDQP